MVRYPNFDVIRLGLACEVFVRHAQHHLYPAFWMPWPILPVPAFLGLSGFLCLQSLERRGIASFWRARLLRIMPALLASLCLVWALFGFYPMLSAFGTYLTAGTAHRGANSPLWSLLPEEIMYFSMCLAWLCGAYRSRVFLWAALTVSCLIAMVAYAESRAVAMYAQLVPSFLTGNLMYVYRDKNPSWIAWPALLLTVRLNVTYPMHPLWMGVSGAAGAFCLILIGRQARQINWKLPDMSYGVYVYHVPLLNAFGWLGIVATPVVAALSWYLIEQPCLRLKDVRLAGRVAEVRM